MAIRVLIFACLVVLATAAPTEPEQSATVPPTITTNVSTSPAEQANQDATSTTPTASMAAGPASEQSKLNNSTFSCYGRNTGYYADIDLYCRVYHFCLPGDFNGEQVYQRISYLCLNDTIFDQQALDCVAAAKITAPCAESPKYYETSNSVLRQALVSHQVTADNTTIASSTTPMPAHAGN